MQFCCGSLRQRDQELLVSSQNNRKQHFVAVKSRGQPPGQDKKESSGKDGPLLLHTHSPAQASEGQRCLHKSFRGHTLRGHKSKQKPAALGAALGLSLGVSSGLSSIPDLRKGTCDPG